MENTDICVNKYICATAIYLLSILEHTYNIIIDHGVLSLRHSRELVHGLNFPEKKSLSMLMTTMQLPGATGYEKHMTIHT